jgi:phenylacetate-CoA ligase
MKKPAGRSDDMLIIRGVNVFPSQIESVLLSLGNTAPYYKLIVDRVNNTDMLEIQVELSQEMFSDTIKSLEEEEKRIKNAIDSTLGISAKITLVEPKSIERVEGKAVRVIDKRKLH